MFISIIRKGTTTGYVRNIADFTELQPDDGVRYQDKLKHLVYALIDKGTVEVEEPVPGGLC
ncbi:MAG: hypothetical protein JO170_03310 [Verrucomicrobia bacterium]|jgi:hypothetical protein|nr:hypothetical protein [Verrucomicrobiota bacterium]MBV8274278.1 hypothetical protein [Verrucomicrobiota bacterium]